MADDRADLLYAFQFPKVTVREGLSQYAGHLTDISCDVLVIEIERQGFKIVRAPLSSGQSGGEPT